MKLLLKYIFTSLLLVPYLLIAQENPAPAPAQEKPIALMNGVAHVGDGTIIENSLITIREGKIETVADARLVRMDLRDYEQINVEGMHVYPGLIAAYSNLGLNEIGAVRATHDYQETGSFNPEVRSLIAYNTDSRVIPTVRSNGILIAQVVPMGGRVSGSSSIVQLDAWNWEDAAYSTDMGIHLNWSSMYERKGWWVEYSRSEEKPEYDAELKELYNFFEQSRAYSQLESPESKNLKMEAMRGLFEGTKRLFIRANNAKEIIAAVQFSNHFDLNFVLVGGRDSWMLTDLLKQNNIPVIVEKTHRMPSGSDAPLDEPFLTPSRLQEAGILFCLTLGVDWDDFYNLRNLPFQAGTAVAYGLSREQALSSITLNTAKILGIDERTGSLEGTKDANIIISKGDILDMRGNDIAYAFIQGRAIDLNNKQKDLYNRYLDKYEIEIK